jgi:hypothetical protein
VLIAIIGHLRAKRSTYYLVVVLKDRTHLESFMRADECRDAFDTYDENSKTNAYILRVVSFEKDERGLMKTGWVYDRIEGSLNKPKDGGLTGEAKILTFPKRKGGE